MISRGKKASAGGETAELADCARDTGRVSLGMPARGVGSRAWWMGPKKAKLTEAEQDGTWQRHCGPTGKAANLGSPRDAEKGNAYRPPTPAGDGTPSPQKKKEKRKGMVRLRPEGGTQRRNPLRGKGPCVDAKRRQGFARVSAEPVRRGEGAIDKNPKTGNSPPPIAVTTRAVNPASASHGRSQLKKGSSRAKPYRDKPNSHPIRGGEKRRVDTVARGGSGFPVWTIRMKA